MQNFYNKRGDTFEPVHFTIRKSTDGGVTQNPVDLSGTKIDMQIREKPGSTVLFIFSSYQGANPLIAISNAIEGKFNTQPTIIDIPAKRYYYDIQIIFPDRVKTWISGYFTITDDITRIE
jgi:hypothetical protein